jgi:CcmD family protein
MIKRLRISQVCAALFVSLIVLASQVLTAQAPASQSEFVPMNSLPPGDQLPAAPLLIAAYAFVWLAVAFYLWTIWARLGRVEREVQALQQKSGRGLSR